MCSLAVGAALLAAALFAGAPRSDSARTLQGALSILGLLLASGGGFMALSTGPVLLATLIAAPRTIRKE